MTDASAAQLAVCERFDAAPYPAPEASKVGIARDTGLHIVPINGLRHLPEGDTSGWYIWAGTELSAEPDFFEPLHVSHLGERCPTVLPYLALPPGWRFLLAPDYEDCWFDSTLLEL
jgi:hypothetical protein